MANGRQIDHQTPRKHQIIEPGAGTQLAVLGDVAFKFHLPAGREVQGSLYVNVPLLAGQQKPFSLGKDILHGRTKVIHQNDFGVDVAEQVVLGGLLRLIVDGVDSGRAVLVASNVSNVSHSEFLGCLRCTRIVAKENDVALGAEKGPAPNSVTLDAANITVKRFGDGKEGQQYVVVLRLGDHF